jgi:hypothetical protein
LKINGPFRIRFRVERLQVNSRKVRTKVYAGPREMVPLARVILTWSALGGSSPGSLRSSATQFYASSMMSVMKHVLHK